MSTGPNTDLASIVEASIEASVEASIETRHGSIEARHGSTEEAASKHSSELVDIEASMEAQYRMSTGPNTDLASIVEVSIEASSEASIETRHGSIEARCGSIEEAAKHPALRH
jgi:hypothetical protein